MINLTHWHNWNWKINKKQAYENTLSTFIGSAICEGFAFCVWPELWKSYGIMGGWLACCLADRNYVV